MAHNLNIVDGKVAFVSSNNLTPWHGLGQVMPEEFLTAEQCIEHAHLNYVVDKTPLLARCTVENTDGSTEKVLNTVDNMFATFRRDTGDTLGVVGNRYEIIQNHEAFNFFDSIVGQGAAIYETAGALGKGGVVFITAKMPNHIKIGKDEITNYIVLRMNHDGKGAIQAMLTPIRVVCQNTLNMAIGAATNKVSVRHLKNVRFHLENAHKVLGMTNTFVDAFKDQMTALSKKKVSDAAFRDLVEILFPGKAGEDGEKSSRITNIHEAVWENYQTGAGQSHILGTAWGAINGIGHYLDHGKDYKNDGEGRFTNLMETTSLLTKQNGLYLLNGDHKNLKLSADSAKIMAKSTFWN